jgi:hypothetical protein
MDEKSILNYGPGSPGETARAITKEFLKLKRSGELDDYEILKRILNARSVIYNSMGLHILNDQLIGKIISNSHGQITFVVLADVFVTNKAQGLKHIHALMGTLELVTEVVVENYNAFVTKEEQITNALSIKLLSRFREFAIELLDKP